MSKYKTLQEAVRHGSFGDMAEYLIDTGNPNQLFDVGDGYYMSTLHLFASAGSKPGINLLLRIGADPNVKDSKGDTPLHSAVIKGRKEAVGLLLDKGADVNAQSNNGDTPLHKALVMRQDVISALLISRGADVNIPNKMGITSKQVSVYNILEKNGVIP